MTERLTKREHDGSVGISALRYYNYDDFQKMAKKLAHYEDLEEQGRLVVLPKGFDLASLKNILFAYCPSYVGLEDWGHDKEKCPSAGCNECWEKALKGEEQ